MLPDEMHVPVGKPIRVNLTSQDVIHSFFVPQFRIKQDAVPGREIPAWFEVTRPGKYEWPCAELCGFGHSGMRGWVFVHTADDYAKWAAENLRAEAPAAPETKPEEPKAGEAKPQAAKPAAKRGTSNR
jgi:cytochrome c oxidase subunit 2